MFGLSLSLSRLSCLSCLLLLLVLLLQLLLLVHLLYLHLEALEQVAKGSGVISFSSRFLQRRHGQRRSPQLGRARQEPRTSHADGPFQIEAPAATQLHWCCCDFVGHVRSTRLNTTVVVQSLRQCRLRRLQCIQPWAAHLTSTQRQHAAVVVVVVVVVVFTCHQTARVCHSCRRVHLIQKEHTRACRLD